MGAGGDVERGKKLFQQKCAQCHPLEKGARNKVGPNLWGLVGRRCGSVPDFKYTDANIKKGITWTDDNLLKYLEDPKKFIPGTKMVFAGLKKAQDRADVVAYLKTAK